MIQQNILLHSSLYIKSREYAETSKLDEIFLLFLNHHDAKLILLVLVLYHLDWILSVFEVIFN